MASENAASMPGPMIASEPEMTQLTATARYRFGESANSDVANPAMIAIRARNRMRPLTLPMNRRLAMRAPITRPTTWNGSVIADATPRPRSSSPNSSS